MVNNNLLLGNNIEESIDSNLELLKYTLKVQSRIKDEINSDFVLAKLDDQTKKGIANMIENAFFMRKIILNEIDYLKEKYHKIDKQLEINLIKIANNIFDIFMIKLQSLVILNRNVINNILLKLIANDSSNENKDELEEKKLLDKIKENSKKGNNQNDIN